MTRMVSVDAAGKHAADAEGKHGCIVASFLSPADVLFFFGCRMFAWDRSLFKPRCGCRCFQACVRLQCRVRKWPDATVCCAAEASDPRVEGFADSCGHEALVNVAIVVSGTGSVNTSYVSLPATTLHFKDQRCLGM